VKQAGNHEENTGIDFIFSGRKKAASRYIIPRAELTLKHEVLGGVVFARD
jgi:hypothetical protein